MRKKHSITVMCATFNENIKADLSQFTDCVVYDRDSEYDCDILLHNFQDNAIKPNIHADKTFVLLHCNYAKMRHSNAFDGHIKYIAVSEDTAKGMRNVYKVDCEAIEPFMPTHKPKKVLRLVSATRLTTEKGLLRMLKLCKLLRQKDIRFQWLVFSDMPKQVADYPEFINMGAQPNDVILDYMADADYVVQLSDHEGYCYSVHEALSVGTPVIVTDIPIFGCVENGYNGFKLRLDMEEVDIERIANHACKNFDYKIDNEDLKNKWENVFR